MKMDEVKKKAVECPSCKRVLKNIYAYSSHKKYCGKTPEERKALSSHLKPWQGWSKGKVVRRVEEVLKEKSQFSTGSAKDLIIKMELKEWKCECCGIVDWNGKHITLELDHINGDNRDHRLENVRLLCPNCHAQTANWRGRKNNTNGKKVSDEDLLTALNESVSIRQALIRVGLTAKGGNYQRCKNLLTKESNNDTVKK